MRIFGFDVNRSKLPKFTRRKGNVSMQNKFDPTATSSALRTPPKATGKFLIVSDSNTKLGIGTSTATPIFWTTASDDETELIELINGLPDSPGNFSTPDLAVIWAIGHDYMVISPKGKQYFPGEGLVLQYDTSRIECYPLKSDILYDLSGNGNNATLYNGPSVDENGWITWNGSNEYARINYNSSMAGWNNSQTILMWLKHNISSGRRNPWDQAYGGYGTWTHEQGGTISQYFGDAGRNASPYIGISSATIPKNVWNLVSTTRNTSQHKWYLNAGLTRTTNHGYNTLTTDTNYVRLGVGYAGYWQGQMGPVAAYDRVLSQEEIESVWYNGDIIKSGLVFAIDAGCLGSYQPGDGVAYNLANNGNSIYGVSGIQNGVRYDPNFGGCWQFDGIDDYISLPPNLDGLSGNTEATLEIWVRLNSNSNSVATTGIIQMSGFNNGNGNLYWYSNNYTYLDIFKTYRVSTTWHRDVIDPREWHLLTITTKLGSNGWKAYLNGVVRKEATGEAVSINSSIQGGLTLGRNNSSRDLSGNIAICRIYDRALGPDEVHHNFQAHKSRFGL